MLLLPRSTSGTIRPNISLIDALFTASSAVCVTGLQVVDTATVFSRFGQCVIMFLIQIGGLGLMTCGILFLVVSHQRNLRSRLFLQDVLYTKCIQPLLSLIIILLSTLLLEAIGAYSFSVLADIRKQPRMLYFMEYFTRLRILQCGIFHLQ